MTIQESNDKSPDQSFVNEESNNFSSSTMLSDDDDIEKNSNKNVYKLDDILSEFSVNDLPERCIQHYRFLQRLHDDGITNIASLGKESVRRYMLWMHLLAKSYNERGFGNNHLQRTGLIPPKDVAWIWHCHRLAPEHYSNFLSRTCWEPLSQQEQYYSILDMLDPAGDPFIIEEPYNSSKSREIWSRYYPNEPFDIDRTKARLLEDLEAPMEDLPSSFGSFNILASARSQTELYWQLQPLFEEGTKRETRNLEEKKIKTIAEREIAGNAIVQYRRFLALFRKYPGRTLVPTYDIDWVWHTHMTAGPARLYRTDCVRLCARIIDHDDSYGNGNRSDTGMLTESFRQTAKLWALEYDDDSYLERGGYRGPPPSDYFPKISETILPSPILAKKIARPKSVVLRKKTTWREILSLLMKRSNIKTLVSKVRLKHLLCLFVVIGVAFILLGKLIVHPRGYVCGSEPPSAQEIAARGAPACLKTSVRKGAMCLKPGEDLDMPSVWCQENVARRGASRSYYLWWSSSTSYGAWRMHKTRDDDKSEFKHSAYSQPRSSQVPRSSRWLDRSWNFIPIGIENCTNDENGSNVNDDGIPLECFAPKEVPALWIAGTTFLGIAGILFLGILCSKCSCQCEASNQRRGHYTYDGGTFVGAGCGGGGGGGGGGCGGGGCGGC